MQCLQLIFTINKAQADITDEVLIALGSIATTFSDANDDAILEPSIGQTPLWQEIIVNALFPFGANQQHITTTLTNICNIDNINFEVLEDKVWEYESHKYFHALQFGQKIWICPSWEDELNLPKDAIVIQMDPGLAFGSGTHQTTTMCLEYLDANPPVNLSVIDYGCGSGVLAIAAAKLAALNVTAVDNDPQAISATMANVSNNNLANKITTMHANNKNQLPQVDLIIANILANPLMELAGYFAQTLKPGAKIVLSGILQDNLANLLGVYDEYFINLKIIQKDDWCLVSGVKK